MKFNETIEELLNAPEGEHYEFKEARNKFDIQETLKYCCALANCGGGKLVLGITDSRPRKIVGSAAFEQPERTRKGLIEKLHINVDFQLYEYLGKRVLVFEIAGRPAGMPVQADGRFWWRQGDSLVPMPAEELRKIFDETGHDFSNDICPGASVNDLDIEAIEVFRKKWMEKSGNTSSKNLTIYQLLNDIEAMIDDEITYAALVLFGKRSSLGRLLPQSEIIFEYRSSEASGPAQQREEFRMGFFSYYNRIWELINLRNDKQHYQDGLFIFDIPTFNERVVRESLLNAVSHRNYQLNGSIFIRQYRDRLVVENPGGLPAGVTLSNIRDRQSPRNRRIAQIFALCGLVERSGQGMNLIYELSVKEAKPLPDFGGTDDYFVCITLNGMILDKQMLLLINKIGNERLESLSTDDFLTINALFHEEKLSKNMHLRIKNLIDMGIIEKISRNKYVLARSLYTAAGKSGVHTRIVGLDRETNKELILKHIRKNGNEGTQLKELYQVLPGHSRTQLQILLRELRDEKKIKLNGKTHGAKWVLT
ncbi:MAG: putative DNA binding domain-containing protein [Treponema sp.]|nr:putative DNA binding domain-containing protein [Treponema sp.]